MANLKRNVFLSLAAVITSMSTISMNVAASQDQTQPVMPLEEDEYLVLTVGESHYSWLGGDLVLVLDASGEEVARLSGYGLTGNGPSMSRGLNFEAVSAVGSICRISGWGRGTVGRGIGIRGICILWRSGLAGGAVGEPAESFERQPVYGWGHGKQPV